MRKYGVLTGGRAEEHENVSQEGPRRRPVESVDHLTDAAPVEFHFDGDRHRHEQRQFQ